MVFFSITAQLIDTILVKITVFTAEQIWYLIRWGGASAYNYYYPQLSELEKIKLENLKLRHEVKLLKYDHNSTNTT